MILVVSKNFFQQIQCLFLMEYMDAPELALNIKLKSILSNIGEPKTLDLRLRNSVCTACIKYMSSIPIQIIKLSRFLCSRILFRFRRSTSFCYGISVCKTTGKISCGSNISCNFKSFIVCIILIYI